MRELIALLLPILRADVEACETCRYEEQPALDVPAPSHDFDAWRRHTTADTRAFWVTGDHLFLQTERTMCLATLVAVLNGIAADHERT